MTNIFSAIENQYTAPIVTKPNVSVSMEDALAASKVKNEPDTFETRKTDNKKKKGPIKTLKGIISSYKKWFATAGSYISGTFKGLKDGVIGGSIIYTAGSAINFIRQYSAQKAGKEIKNIPNKFIAIAVGVAALAVNLWNASLEASDKRSEIEHMYEGHKQ